MKNFVAGTKNGNPRSDKKPMDITSEYIENSHKLLSFFFANTPSKMKATKNMRDNAPDTERAIIRESTVDLKAVVISINIIKTHILIVVEANMRFPCL